MTATTDAAAIQAAARWDATVQPAEPPAVAFPAPPARRASVA